MSATRGCLKRLASAAITRTGRRRLNLLLLLDAGLRIQLGFLASPADDTRRFVDSRSSTQLTSPPSSGDTATRIVRLG